MRYTAHESNSLRGVSVVTSSSLRAPTRWSTIGIEDELAKARGMTYHGVDFGLERSKLFLELLALSSEHLHLPDIKLAHPRSVCSRA